MEGTLLVPIANVRKLSADEVIFLAYVAFKGKDKGKNKWHEITAEMAESDLGMTYPRQLRLVKSLTRKGYLLTKIMGVPPKRYFCLTDPTSK
jgi:hypothetical protein